MDIKAKMTRLSDFMVMPIVDIPWNCPQFTVEDVMKAVEEKQFNTGYDYSEKDTVSHIRRIAYFYVHGWTDAVVIDVGCPSLGYTNGNPVIDGNHRLYAASLRGNDTILCSIEGEIDYAMEILT